LGWFEDGDGLA